MHYELFTKSFYNKVIDLSVVFNPVDTPTEKETAEVAKIWADIDASYVSAGVMSAEEVRDIRRSEEGSPYSTLADDIENEVSQEVEQVADEALDKDYDDDIIGWARSKSGKVFPIRKTKREKKAKLGVKQDLRSKRISKKELGTIKTDLFKNFNEVKAQKGDIYPCKTAKYRYIIQLNESGNLANFTPLFRWRIK